MTSSPYLPTSASLLIAALRRYGDRIAVTAGDKTYSYADLDDQSARLAGYLKQQGFGPGSRIALHLKNGIEYVVSELAILKLAAIRIPLNELMGQDELGYCLAHAGAQVLIAHASLPLPTMADGTEPKVLRISVADGAAPRPGDTPWPDTQTSSPLGDIVLPQPDETAILAYTGGTTGYPKAVRHTYGRMAHNLFAHIVCGDIRSDEVMLLTTPLPHSAGFHMAACLLQGGHVILERRFDPTAFLRTCVAHGVTWTFAVPTMLYRLLDAMDRDSQTVPALRTIVYGAAPMSRPRLEQALARLGPVFIQIYGQTECPNFITSLDKTNHLDPRLLASCGRAVPFAELRISQPDANTSVGEIEVRSPYLLVEYFRNEVATAEALQDGWLRTGDLGYLEDGFLFLVDRAKDMIITGGMNVYSSEVEAALRKHASVAEVAVVGLPDDDWGEVVTAVVVPVGPASEDTLRLFAKASLSAYKVPKTIVFMTELPLTNYGKIDKKRLRLDLQA